MLNKPILAIALAAAIMAGAGYWMMHRQHQMTPPTPVYQAGGIEISQVISRPTAPGAPGVGYFQIANNGDQPDRLISVTTDIAEAQLHETKAEGNVMKMRAMPEGKALQPGDVALFEPGGDHVMLLNLKKSLVVGDRIRATFTFEKAGTLDVFFDVMDGKRMSGHNH